MSRLDSSRPARRASAVLIAAATLIAVAVGEGRARAATLDEVTGKIAAELTGYMSSKLGTREVHVRATEGGRKEISSLFKQKLEAQLKSKAHRMTIGADTCRYELRSFVKLPPDDGGDAALAMLLKVSLHDTSRQGAEVLGWRKYVSATRPGSDPTAEIVEDVTDVEDVVAIASPNFDATLAKQANGTGDATRKAVIKESLKKPLAHLADGYVLAAEKSPYRMTLARRGKGGTLVSISDRFYTEQGLGGVSFPYIDLYEGEEYVVTLENHSPLDIAVKLSIDGLSVFHFTSQNADRDNDIFIVPGLSDENRRAGLPNKLTVPGWYLTDGNAKAFEVVALPNSAAASLGRDDNSVGKIQARIFGAWPAGTQPPALYVPAGSDRGVGTGLGKLVTADYGRLERDIGTDVLAAITLFYVKPPELVSPPDLPPAE